MVDYCGNLIFLANVDFIGFINTLSIIVKIHILSKKIKFKNFTKSYTYLYTTVIGDIKINIIIQNITPFIPYKIRVVTC